MPPEATPPAWVGTIQREIAEEAFHLLGDVIRQFDLGKSGVLRISGYAHDSPDRLPIGNEAYWRVKRTEVARMLVARGVLRGAEARYVGGSPYIGDADRGDWLFVEGDEQTVREIAEALGARLHPARPAPRPAPPVAAAPAGGTTNYFGPVTHVNTTGDNATINVTVNANDLAAVVELVRRVQADIDKLTLEADDAAKLQSEVEALDAETKAAKPEKGRLRKGVEMVLGTLAKAGASAAATGLVHLAGEALRHLM